ncbi:MAG: hypothetical protein ACFE0Q_05515 [Anaerolineae bacterium]
MSSNYKIQTDLTEAQAMVEGLADYVRGDQLFGHAGAGFFSKMPSLTIGALVMRLHRLSALRDQLSNKQQSKLDEAINNWQSTRREWRSHYEGKLLHEIESRLDSMQTFFKECADSQQSCHNNYRPEIQKRTIVQVLLDEMDELGIEDDEIHKIVKEADGKLRTYLRSDDFQWSDTLTKVYPQDTFWWLYQKPPQALHEA